MNNKKFTGIDTKYLARASVIAALYAALTLVIYPLSFGAIQLRFSEAMCILPLFYPEAVPGLFVGCVVSNLLSPNIPILDVTLGSLATLLSAILTRMLRNSSKRTKFIFAPLPAVILNALLVGLVVSLSATSFGEGFMIVYLTNCLYVGIGQAIVCYPLGIILIILIDKIKNRIDKTGANDYKL